MTTPNRKSKIQIGERYCREHGYVKHGANWYRCYGQGLLQVVTFNGLPERISDSSFLREPSVALSIRSLYDWIKWINIPIMGAKRALIPGIVPKLFMHEQELLSVSTSASDAELMVDYGFPLLDQIDTHTKLADLLEYLDKRNSHAVIANDPNNVIPYLLSGKHGKVLETIDAIEQQNLHAYAINCSTIANYDSEAQKEKMNNSLYPYISLRESIAFPDVANILAMLQSNYQANVDYLSGIGIPIPANCASHAELITLMNMH